MKPVEQTPWAYGEAPDRLDISLGIFISGLRLHSRTNGRGSWRIQHARDRATKHVVAYHLLARAPLLRRARFPLEVVITRVGPNGLDPTDNLPASAKAVIDQVCKIVGVDDRRTDLLRIHVEQRKPTATEAAQAKPLKFYAVELRLRSVPGGREEVPK